MLWKPKPRTRINLSHPLNSAVVGAWLLGEGQFDYCYDSGPNRLDARFSNNGGSDPYARAPWMPGRSGGKAWRMFAPGNQYLATANYTPPTGNMTVTAWVNPSTIGGNQIIVGQWNETGNHRSWVIACLAASNLIYGYASSDGSSYREYHSTSAITLNAWFMLTVTYPASGGTTSVYINGVAQATGTSGTQAYLGINAFAQPIYIGYSPNFAGGATGRGWDGGIETVRIDSRILTDAEIARLYAEQHVGYQQSGRVVSQFWLYAPLPTITGSLGLVSETDVALPLVAGKQVVLGLNSETDSALAITAAKGGALGLASEDDAALPLIWSRLLYWPFDDLKPRHIGIYPIAATIGGGVALTNKEPAIDSGAGFWKIEYGSVPLMTRAKILKWRELEAKAEGRGQIIAVPIYDGKRAPWPGAPGGAIDVAANADAAVGDTTLEVLVNDAGTLAIGQHFSADSRLYRIKSVSDLGSGVFSLGIWPKLRAVIRSGDALEFRRPLCRVRLATDDAMALDLSLLKFGDPSVTFVEAL